jgi:hypothetical protein
MENGLHKDRRLRADGFIIRAQATIRTDGFLSVQGFGNCCAAQATIRTDGFFVRARFW